MRRPHKQSFHRALNDLRAAADAMRRAHAESGDRYDPALRAARVRYAQVRARVAEASAKAQEEERQLRHNAACLLLFVVVGLVLAAASGLLPVFGPWLDQAESVGAIIGLALAVAIALILHGSPSKMLDTLMHRGLSCLFVVADWLGVFGRRKSRNSQAGPS